MAIFEAESWLVAEGKDKEHDVEMRRWLQWVKDHRELFPEWKSVRYFEKHTAGDQTGRRFIVWEYDSFTDYENYKTRRKDYEGPYKEYKENDPIIRACSYTAVWSSSSGETWSAISG